MEILKVLNIRDDQISTEPKVLENKPYEEAQKAQQGEELDDFEKLFKQNNPKDTNVEFQMPASKSTRNLPEKFEIKRGGSRSSSSRPSVPDSQNESAFD